MVSLVGAIEPTPHIAASGGGTGCRHLVRTVSVAERPKTRGHDRVRALAQERVAHVALEMVPARPPHRRREPDSVVKRAHGRDRACR